MANTIVVTHRNNLYSEGFIQKRNLAVKESHTTNYIVDGDDERPLEDAFGLVELMESGDIVIIDAQRLRATTNSVLARIDRVNPQLKENLLAIDIE